MKGLEPPPLTGHGPSPTLVFASLASELLRFARPLHARLPAEVPERGLEPPPLTGHGPKPCASAVSPPWLAGGSASSATSARTQL